LRTGIVLTAAFAGVASGQWQPEYSRPRGKRSQLRFLRGALLLAGLLLANFLFTGLTSWVTKDEDANRGTIVPRFIFANRHGRADHCIRRLLPVGNGNTAISVPYG